MINTSRGRYLKPDRLGDVIAAIQVMAMYRRYRASLDRWADRISGSKRDGVYWKSVFDEHPEFFRESAKYPGTYSLVWRRAAPHFDLKERRQVSDEEADALPEADRLERITRQPVPETEIKHLIDIAIGMHAQEIEGRRWWVPSVLSLVGSFAGALLGFAASGFFHS